MMEQIDKLSKEIKNNDSLKIIKNQGILILNLIYDIQDIFTLKNNKFHKINTPNIIIKDVFEQIKYLFEDVIAAKGLKFIIKYGQNIPYSATIDERRIKQILINLVKNAIKFTENGSITIECNYDQT